MYEGELGPGESPLASELCDGENEPKVVIGVIDGIWVGDRQCSGVVTESIQGVNDIPRSPPSNTLRT